MQAHFARYLCILTSGFLENSFRLILSSYVEKSCAPNAIKFINIQLKNITNLKSSKIESILNSFSDYWQVSYLNDLTDTQKDAIDSLVANRNQIAHGQSVGVTYVRILNYYNDTKDLINTLKQIILN